ncbi:restriction endonuclease subunit S [Faecalibacterium sp.]|uniref:restriction endonuclease subunit S n=1 Tax=Faecalibacterium sp. TaxID=1971605 RepID=UPI003527D1A4
MKKRLGDYIQEYSVRNKSGEDIPVYSITNSQGFCRDYFSKEVASKDKTSYKIVPRGCFAYNPSRINVGSVDWQRDEERVIVSPLYNVFSVSPEIDQQYLYYYLKSSATSYRIKEVATGSVRDNLRLSMLYDFMIELPSLDVQRQIVSNLDLLASIIRQRNQQLTKLDELIKARFVEMFGDMLLNSLEWPEKPLEGLADIVSGITKGRKTTETGLIEVPYMAVSNVKSGYIDWTTIKTILATKQEIEQYRLMPDDILMTEGGDPDKVGRGAIIKNPLKDSIHQNHIFRVRLDKSELLPAYFAEYLQHQKAKRYFLGCAKQTTGIASINMRQLRALPVLIPPLPLQNQFAAFVAEVDKSKVEVQKALDQTQLLFDSLMQQYFG